MNPVLKRVLTGMSLGGVIIAAVMVSSVAVIASVSAVLAVLAICELCRLVSVRWRRDPFRSVAAFAFFAVLIVSLFRILPYIAAKHGNLTLLFVLAIVKFSDVGGFAFGHLSAKLMRGGNHKMCPSVSPGKSWEGLLGSFVFSSLAAVAFVPLARFGHVPASLLEYGLPMACAFGLVASVVGTAGDLVESKLKRWIGVKDSSTMKITNGLGGFLDMFDSLLFAPAVLLAFL